MITTTFTIKGMTCGHCVSAVSQEIGKLDGVAGVAVELETGRVTVTSDATLDTDIVRAAINEAGYELMP
ncbi:MAG: heavy-metal-associated domain-containing protein [Acidimicrobiales bacterium]